MEILSAITDNAAQHVTWTLMLLAGTLLTVVGTSHVSPETTKGRSFYLLLIPGWAVLVASMYFGDRVQRRAISALMVDDETLRDTHRSINADFNLQLNLMLIGGGFLALWLLFYVVWWICCRRTK